MRLSSMQKFCICKASHMQTHVTSTEKRQLAAARQQICASWQVQVLRAGNCCKREILLESHMLGLYQTLCSIEARHTAEKLAMPGSGQQATRKRRDAIQRSRRDAMHARQ